MLKKLCITLFMVIVIICLNTSVYATIRGRLMSMTEMTQERDIMERLELKVRPFVFPTVYMILILVLLGVVYYSGLFSSSYSLTVLENVDFIFFD